ncbi:aldo/keto reductase [Isosphaera pallida ATCC 43644]|jgi:predicted aldo/keto reductase-like oxidoreductase|uniref:Aldo/keto reductase n=1 Tax=Isosphaera pallida (strain ATCC 43644 / DSM 9630 / IS1B) TaxID=575540 RepID=E8R6S0_ISOPI|nr:aldo/keto reductase [Isosphaera pallida]ADV63972.1 aldo/keto reductase [Isosphaera pallida ATCC 43644]
MSEPVGLDNPTNPTRRDALKLGVTAATTAAVIGAVSTARAAVCIEPVARRDDEKGNKTATPPKELPRRPLGKTGVEVTILNQGTWRSPALDRLVRYAYAQGIRYYDTAKSYGSEPGLSRWFKAMPEVRKNIFLVTKDSPSEPKQLVEMLDRRLETLQVDWVDLLFVHALGDSSIENGLKWPKSKEFKAVCETIRKSGKAKLVGFSTHHPRRAEIIQAAAEGGFVDAIMLQYSPFLEADSPLNKALDACHARGIGLISMKQVAGFGGQAIYNEVFKRMPELKEKGYTPYQALLHAIWTDERIASVCVSMRNLDQINENVEAARKFRPMDQASLDRLREACIAARPTMCADCDGRCSRAAGTTARLGDLARFHTYHEHHGYRSVARERYAELSPEERDWTGADLIAAREACPRKLDFASILPQVDRNLA